MSIKWPYKWGKQGDYQLGWDEAIDACVTAEKESRVSVDEIYKIIINQKYFVEGKGWIHVARFPESAFNLAKSVHKAVYGEESKP